MSHHGAAEQAPGGIARRDRGWNGAQRTPQRGGQAADQGLQPWGGLPPECRPRDKPAATPNRTGGWDVPGAAAGARGALLSRRR